MLDQKTLQQLSKQMEIDEFTILREYLQIRFLDVFYRKIGVEEIFFKGGTAIRLLFGSTRFSEDLDFTNKVRPENLEQLLQKTLKGLQSEFPRLSLKELDAPQGYSAKLVLPTEISQQNLTVKLDFTHTAVYENTQLSPVKTQLPVASLALTKHLSRKEILAEKFRALWRRKRGRDLFDIWFLLSQGEKFDQKLVQKKYDLYQEKLDLQQIREKIDRWDEKELDHDLRKFLPRAERRIIPELKRLALENLPT
jgi:predicted nucleotidyltransferase component of viral defense system